MQLSAADGRVFACWQREPSLSGGTLPADRLGYNVAPGGGVHIVWRHGDSGDNVDAPAGYKYSLDYGATRLPRVIAIDTTKTAGANHPWAIVANRSTVHIITGPSGKMQYVRRTF